jgi:predicted metal-dependent hydrolase
MLDEWESKIGVQTQGWDVKKMKTKWGSCNTSAKRIWLNLDLAKKPKICVEYILVHELTHPHERNHNDRFRELMAQYLPDWSSRRKLLNRAPLAHEDWVY